MNKTAEYIDFEEGFLKEAAADGCDIPFLRGLIKEADDQVDAWKAAFDELAEQSQDPLYHIKLANEIVFFANNYQDLIKEADINGSMQQFLGDTTQSLGLDNINQHSDFLKKYPNLLAGAGIGGGGGGLIGLILGALMGHPGMGMMLGGLGGAGLGAGFGSGYLQHLFNDQGSSGSEPTEQAPASTGITTGPTPQQAGRTTGPTPQQVGRTTGPNPQQVGRTTGPNPPPNFKPPTPQMPPPGPIGPGAPNPGAVQPPKPQIPIPGTTPLGAAPPMPKLASLDQKLWAMFKSGNAAGFGMNGGGSAQQVGFSAAAPAQGMGMAPPPPAMGAQPNAMGMQLPMTQPMGQQTIQSLMQRPKGVVEL